MIDPKFFNQVAQNAHVLAGICAALLTLMFIPQYAGCAALAFLVVTGVKEFWYDQNYENATTRGSNLNDWTHYQLGWGGGLCLHLGQHVSPWFYAGTLLTLGAGFFIPWITTYGKST